MSSKSKVPVARDDAAITRDADYYLAAGDLERARDLYWRILDAHPGTPAAKRARARLGEIETGGPVSGAAGTEGPTGLRWVIAWIAVLAHAGLAGYLAYDGFLIYQRAGVLSWETVAFVTLFLACALGILADLGIRIPGGSRGMAIWLTVAGAGAGMSFLLCRSALVIERWNRHPEDVWGVLLPLAGGLVLLVVATLVALQARARFDPPRWLTWATFGIAALAVAVRTVLHDPFMSMFLPAYTEGLTGALGRAALGTRVDGIAERVAVLVWLPWAWIGTLRG